MKKQENKRGEAGERPWLRATLAALRGGLLACGAAVLLLLAAACLISTGAVGERWLSDYGYVPRAFCGVGYAIELTDGYGGLSDQAVVQYAIDMIIKDGRYYPVLDESDYERREDAWLRDYFDGEVSDAMLGGADRDAVFEAWRDDADPVSGDMYFDMEKLPGYIETAKGGKRNA